MERGGGYFPKGNIIGFNTRFKEGHKTLRGVEKGWFKKGNVLSKEVRLKISKKLKGRLPKNWLIAIKKAAETNRKLTGEKSHSWKGGLTTQSQIIRRSLEYKLWRQSIFERDNYTCVWCGERGKKLQADHIKPFCDYPELRFAIDNGRTLCLSCHKKTDTFLLGARWSKYRKVGV